MTAKSQAFRDPVLSRDPHIGRVGHGCAVESHQTRGVGAGLFPSDEGVLPSWEAS